MKRIFCICLVCWFLIESAFWCYGQDFFEFVGPRLGYKNSKIGETDDEKITEKEVTKHGYPFETHTVITHDGYVITLHRIPYGRNKIVEAAPRSAILVYHGLVGSTDMFILQGPEYDLSYYLADGGYDVWFSNCRGNVYSRKHTHLNPDKDPEYWDFSMLEVGLYDIPASIDHILNITNQQDLFFMGYSFGGFPPLITCSMLPEYNKKIRLIMGIQMLSQIQHMIPRVPLIVYTFIRDAYPLFKSQNIYEFFPRRKLVNGLIERACSEGSPLYDVCYDFRVLFFGEDFGPENTNGSLVDHLLRIYPSGTSTKLVYSAFQYYLSGDYANDVLGVSRDNPPFYNLTKVTVPATLHFSDNDPAITQRETDDLCAQLGNCVGKYRIPYAKYNHLDLIIGNNAKRFLFRKLVRLMKKYSKKQNI